MISRNRARSGDGRKSPETVILKASKTVRQKMTQGNSKNPKKGSKKWKETVLEKWRGALVKARLALYKKREKKKERYARCTLARLRKCEDAARKKPQGEPIKSITEVRRGKESSPRSAATDLKLITKVKRGRKISPLSAPTDLDEGQEAKVKAQMERKEEVKNKWRNTLELARCALQQKRERKKEQAQKAAIRRRRKSQWQGEGFPDNNIVQLGLPLKRPSLEELRNFAKKLTS